MKFAILATTLAAVAATPSPPPALPAQPAVATFESTMTPQASSLGDAAALKAVAEKYPEKFFPPKELPPGTVVTTQATIKKVEKIEKKTVACDCGTQGCSCRRRLQETARRLAATGTKTIEKKTVACDC